MIEADHEEFLKIIRGFASLKGKPALSSDALSMYWYAMLEWRIEEFRSAAVHLLRTLAFMPQPADFEKLRKTGRQTAGEAFARAVQTSKSCSQRGYMNDNVTSDDPLIDRAVRAIGGYCCFAMCDVDKLHFLERRFTEHYESIQDAGDVREWLPQLPRDRPHELTEAGKLAKTILRELTTDTHRARGNGSS
jgi:hypothetical protein